MYVQQGGLLHSESLSGLPEMQTAVCVQQVRSFAQEKKKTLQFFDAINESLHVSKLQKFLAGNLL